MRYKVIDRVTGEDITDKYDWVITPNGELKYNDYGDLTGCFEADYIIEGIYLMENEIPEKEEYYLGMSDLAEAGVDSWNYLLKRILEIGHNRRF